MTDQIDVEFDDVIDRVSFTLSDQDWKTFCQAINAPPRTIPDLNRLLHAPGVFDVRRFTRTQLSSLMASQ